MKNIIKSLLVLSLLSSASFAFADTDAEWKTKISDMRAVHAELKAEVEAGTLTKEEARGKWADALEEFRAEKRAYFEARMEKINQRVFVLAQRNPERASELAARIDAAAEKREANAKARVELRAKVKAGEVTREEAQEIREEKREEFNERKEEIQEKREEIKKEAEERKAARVEAGADARVQGAGAVRVNANVEARPVDPQRATDYNSSRSNKNSAN